MDLTKFAEREDDAELRALEFKDNDPFPSIEPALLSSAEFRDYARATAQIIWRAAVSHVNKLLRSLTA